MQLIKKRSEDCRAITQYALSVPFIIIPISPPLVIRDIGEAITIGIKNLKFRAFFQGWERTRKFAFINGKLCKIHEVSY